MKRFSIFLLLISFLLFAEILTAKHEDHDSLAQKIKRGAEHSKEFALSKDTGNLLLFALSAGFLIYLPKHLSKYKDYSILNGMDENFVDYIIRRPRHWLFGRSAWPAHLYYELLTLFAGYICLKTGKPYWEKLKKS